MDTCADCGKPFNGLNDVGWVQNDPFGKTTVVKKFHSGCGDPFGVKAKDKEIARLRAGLNIIAQAGTVHGGAWCVAQAYGTLNDLDFDQWPETGKPPEALTS